MNLQKIALILFLLLFMTTFSQTEKGKFLINASSTLNFRFDSNSVKGDSYSRDAGSTKYFTISPKIGYAIKNNLFIGIDLTYDYLDIDDKDYGYKSTTNSILASPFVKYYFLQKKIKPFLLAKYGFGSSTDKSLFIFGSNEPYTDKRKFSKYNIGAGISYFFNKNINIEFSLNYSKSVRKPNDTENEKNISNSFNSNIGFSLFL